jgi:hypothetical protein
MNWRYKELEQVDVVDGTAAWLNSSDEFISWVSSGSLSQEQPLLVIEGKPGSGKSVLMQRAFAHARSHCSSVPRGIYLSFFFDASKGDDLQNSFKGLCRSLLSQLLGQITPSAVVLRLVEDWDREGYEHEATLQDRIRQLLRQIWDRPVVIFIDALDECDQRNKDAAKRVVRFGRDMWKDCRLVKLCLSMRESRWFGSDLATTQLVRVDSKNEDDILRYLEKNLKPPGDSHFREKLIDKLLRRSSNMFQWVELVVRSINEMAYSGSELEVENVVESLPEKLKDLYKSLIEQLPPSTRNEASAALQLVQVAARPLTVLELRSALEYALGNNDGRKEYDATTAQRFEGRLVHICQGLLQVRTRPVRRPGGFGEMFEGSLHFGAGFNTSEALEERVVQFTHHSVKEFLGSTNYHLEGVEISTSSELIAQAHLKTAAICMLAVKLQNRHALSKERPAPFLSYATQFWTLHSRKGGSAGLDEKLELPGFVTKCTPRTREMISQWKLSVVKGMLYNVGGLTDDFPNTRLLGQDESCMFVLLAFEGCNSLLTRHERTCPKWETCHGNASVLETAIFLAANRGWAATIKTLGEIAAKNCVKVNLNRAHPGWQTPLFTACFFNHTEAVAALLELGCDTVGKGGRPAFYPVHRAVEAGRINIVKLLLEASGFVDFWFDARDAKGYTLFHAAAGNGRWSVFSWLVEELLDRTESPEEILSLVSTSGGATAQELAVAGRNHVLQSARSYTSIQSYDNIIATLEEYAPRSGKRRKLHR